MTDRYEYKRQEIRQIYKGLEKFTPKQDREKNKAILEEYLTIYLKQAQKRRIKKVTNLNLAFDNIAKVLLDYIDTLQRNTKTRNEQGNKYIEGTFVESTTLENKLKKAINSLWIP